MINDPDYFLKHVVLLETRLAKNIPNFDYNLMKNDDKILHFEKTVERKLSIKKSK